MRRSEEENFGSKTSESNSDDELPPNLQTLEKGDDSTTGTQGETFNLAEQVSSTWTATLPLLDQVSPLTARSLDCKPLLHLPLWSSASNCFLQRNLLEKLWRKQISMPQNSSRPVTADPFFGTLFSQDRFLLLFRYLHFFNSFPSMIYCTK